MDKRVPHEAGADAAVRQIDLVSAQLPGDVTVWRALPTRALRTVGPWCFLDVMGPGNHALHTGQHPHTALQTLTWMIEGEMLHRDSLGYEQIIRPGQVNLMTAGHGISHTEDTLMDPSRLHAVQFWIALPPGKEVIAPAFEHEPQPINWQGDPNLGDVRVTLLAGKFGNQDAGLGTHSPLVGLDLASEVGGALILPLESTFEHAVIVLRGNVHLSNPSIEDVRVTPDTFVALPPGQTSLSLRFAPDARCILIGGEPRSQKLHMWWNFVGPSRSYIEQAWTQWQSAHARFGGAIRDVPRLEAPRPAWMRAS